MAAGCHVETLVALVPAVALGPVVAPVAVVVALPEYTPSRGRNERFGSIHRIVSAANCGSDGLHFHSREERHRRVQGAISVATDDATT